MLQGEGTIKGEHDRALGLLLPLSGCFNTSIWVFSKPQTLYFSCLGAPQVGSISRMHSVASFSISMHPDLFGGLLSYCDFIYLMVTRQTTTSSPWTWYRVKHGSQPFGSELQGWDKLLVWCESLPVYLVYLCLPQCGYACVCMLVLGAHPVSDPNKWYFVANFTYRCTFIFAICLLFGMVNPSHFLVSLHMHI